MAARPALRSVATQQLQPTGTVLLVDDDKLVRLSTSDMLSDLGYTVVEPMSADEAQRLVRCGLGFDVLVTDHLMAGMTGTELARELRCHRPDTPVLLVSGYAESDGIAPDLTRLAKPFSRDELAAAVAGLPRRKRDGDIALGESSVPAFGRSSGSVR